MTDIILGESERPGRARTWILLLLGLILLVAGAVYWFHRPAPTTTPDTPAPTAHAPTAPASKSAAPAAAPVVDNAAPLVDEVQRLVASDNLREARAKALDVLAQNPADPTRRRTEALLDKIDIDLVLSPREMAEKADYVVQSGDSLDKIAKKFGTTVDLIRKSNNVAGSVIRAGQHLRILTSKFEIHVDKSDNTLTVLLDGKYFKRYSVGTGQYNKTPVGTFKITDRIAQPTWWRPDGKQIPYGDPENLLGTHWLAIDSPGYGIHGTWQPDSIGKQSSAGCVRLLNEDIEQLFTLMPIGTPVIIQD